ncbi:hypothetical protein TH8_05335 [Thalassospira profundimaris]|nr:hypothetical protein TH8_05335 [Thalassospira profundimaris]
MTAIAGGGDDVWGGVSLPKESVLVLGVNGAVFAGGCGLLVWEGQRSRDCVRGYVLGAGECCAGVGGLGVPGCYVSGAGGGSGCSGWFKRFRG